MSLGLATAALAQDDRTFSSGYRFVEMTGEELFANVCQGCHMPDAAGATGAGSYPSLAGNSNLEAGGYPILIVVNGRRGMPPFGDMMSGRPGRRGRELSADTFRQQLPGRGDGQGRQGRAPLK